MLFHTRNTRLNSPGTLVVAMSPTTTGRSTSLIFALNRAAIGADSSMPTTGTPRCTSGIPMRPVPIAKARAGPDPAKAARKSTAGSTTSGANISAASSS